MEICETSIRGLDLGLYMMHHLMVFLRDCWTIWVMQVVPLNSCACKFELNRRRGEELEAPHPFLFRDDPASCEELTQQAQEAYRIQTPKVQRHFARMGFHQSSRQSCDYWFITKEEYFSKSTDVTRIPEAWLSKSDADSIEINEPPLKRAMTPIDSELRSLIQSGDDAPSPESIRALIDRGATVDGALALHVAAVTAKHAFLFHLLIGLGANVNHVDEGETYTGSNFKHMPNATLTQTTSSNLRSGFSASYRSWRSEQRRNR